jgi:lipopolysaccharide/colanic/teichoic acid biosynthesis glycosyltransferase
MIKYKYTRPTAFEISYSMGQSASVRLAHFSLKPFRLGCGAVKDRISKMFPAPLSSRVGHRHDHDSCERRTANIPAWKRGLDILGCLAALPLLALSTLFAAVMIKMASPGPIFFLQERVGYRGRRFKLYKFRTMHVAADVTTHQAHFADLVRSNVPMHKLDTRGDRRLVPGGWLLRASGLDELPQVINVLRGEMSLVGPRPSIPYEYEQYSPAQRERFSTVPGLTGLWQVSGKNRTTFDEMIRLDIHYAMNRSLGLDVKIIAKTLPALWVQVSDTRKAKAVGAARTKDLLPASPGHQYS